MASITWHYVFKFIITGDSAVGKSSLLVRLTDQRFLVNPDPTLGVEFGSKLIHLHDQGQIIKLQCWDTAGTESFRSITRSYYRGAAGCLLVYDVTNRASFLNAQSWLTEVREHADPHLTCILVGNKIDLCSDDDEYGEGVADDNNHHIEHNDDHDDQQYQKDDSEAAVVRDSRLSKRAGHRRGRRRQVMRAEAERWAQEEGLLFVEASAKSGRNVELAFERATRDILDKIKRGVFDDDRPRGVKLSTPTTNIDVSGRSGCCT